MNDTDAAAEAFQISLIRKADSTQRFHAMRSLSETVIRFSQEAIRRSSPDLPEKEYALKFLAHHYGDDLAARVNAFLKARQQ